MTEKQSGSVPIWVWLLGGCALLTLILACLAAVVFFFGGFLFVAAAPVASGPPSVVTVVAVTVAPESGQTDSSQNDNESEPSTDTPPQTPTPPGNEPEETADPGGDSEDLIAETRQEIESNVIELRGLPQLEAVIPTALTSEELRTRLEADFMEDYSPEESRLDVLTLSAFDFLERDFDLYNFTIDLYTEQVAGFYDPETDEFVVISSGEASFGVLEQFTYAHEFVHALQDQHFSLDLLSDESLDSEAAFAIRALAEGDATLAQTLYISEGYFSQEQLLEIITAAGALDSSVFNSAPPVLSHELEFPYTSGLNFVQTLYAQGGYSAVDDAWNNLPQSTEQIIHPERYLSGDEPQIVSLQPLTDTLGAGWQRLDEDTLGEFYLREYLAQQLNSTIVETAATGWGGDRYTVYWNEASEQIVMVLKLVWDTTADSDEFAAAYEAYPAQLFGATAASQPDGSQCWQGTDVICLYQNGDETMIVRAPDLETAAAIAAAQAAE
jgi:hypothetical protein